MSHMVDYKYVYTFPDRPNIFYEVHQCSNIETSMKPVLSSLRDHQNRAPRIAAAQGVPICVVYHMMLCNELITTLNLLFLLSLHC